MVPAPAAMHRDRQKSGSAQAQPDGCPGQGCTQPPPKPDSSWRRGEAGLVNTAETLARQTRGPQEQHQAWLGLHPEATPSSRQPRQQSRGVAANRAGLRAPLSVPKPQERHKLPHLGGGGEEPNQGSPEETGWGGLHLPEPGVSLLSPTALPPQGLGITFKHLGNGGASC